MGTKETPGASAPKLSLVTEEGERLFRFHAVYQAAGIDGDFVSARRSADGRGWIITLAFEDGLRTADFKMGFCIPLPQFGTVWALDGVTNVSKREQETDGPMRVSIPDGLAIGTRVVHRHHGQGTVVGAPVERGLRKLRVAFDADLSNRNALRSRVTELLESIASLRANATARKKAERIEMLKADLVSAREHLAEAEADADHVFDMIESSADFTVNGATPTIKKRIHAFPGEGLPGEERHAVLGGTVRRPNARVIYGANG